MRKWVLFTLILLLSVSAASASTFHFDESRTGNFTAIGPNIPGLLWRTNITGLIGASPVYHDGNIFITNWYARNGNPGLYCINASTGEVIWRNENITGASTVAVANGLLFVGNFSGEFYCINATTGKIIWKRILEDNPSWWGIASSPLIYNNKVYVTTFSKGTLHALDVNGNELWNFSTGEEISHYTSPSACNSMIFFAGNTSLYCLNEDGEELWNFSTDSKITNTPAINYDKVFFATEDKLYAVNVDGTESWNTSLNGTISTAALAYGNVYIGSEDGVLHCINATTGNELWNFTANGKIDSSPAIANGVVYFATNTPNGTMYALNAFDGNLVWNYSLNPPSGSYYNIMSSPFLADGKLFIGADDGYVYCFSSLIWRGWVELNPAEIVVELKDGRTTKVDGYSALAALLKASEIGGFNITIVNSTWGLYVESIADVKAEGMKGWMYTVNGDMPAVGVADYELSDGDTLDFFYGSWGMTAEEADYRIIIYVNLTNVIWTGSVELKQGNFTVVAKSNESYEVSNLTALGALNAASLAGGFNYTVCDKWFETWHMLLVDSIYGIENNGTSGWMYWVNYPEEEMPMVGANKYKVRDGDVVYWFYSESMNDTPSNSPYVIKIVVRTEKVFIESFDVSNGTRGGNAIAWINLTALDGGWYVIVVSGTNNGESIAGISTFYVNENEEFRIPVLIAIPQQVSAGEYKLYAGVYRLDDYPGSILNWYGSQRCEVN